MNKINTVKNSSEIKNATIYEQNSLGTIRTSVSQSQRNSQKLADTEEELIILHGHNHF